MRRKSDRPHIIGSRRYKRMFLWTPKTLPTAFARKFFIEEQETRWLCFANILQGSVDSIEGVCWRDICWEDN